MTTETTAKRGRPAGSTNDRTSAISLIATVSGKTTAQIREEALRIGTEKLVGDLRGEGIDIDVMQARIRAAHATA